MNVYVLGLLNRVGLFALAAVQPAPLSKLLQSADPAPLAERLRKEFGFDHRDAGYALLRQWSVPGPIIEAMNPGTNAPVGSSLHVALAKRCMEVCQDASATIQQFSGQLERHGIALSASELMSRHQKAHDKARQICSSVM